MRDARKRLTPSPPSPPLPSGDELNLQVTITDPEGQVVYTEGPFRTHEITGNVGPASEGSFRFRLFRVGTYRVTLFNPTSSASRRVTFAWLVGRDADDAYTARGLPPGGFGGAEQPRNATGYVTTMIERASRVHKNLDELVALQQFADVRFSRALHAAKLTLGRVSGWTLFESAVVVLVSFLQALLLRSFQVQGPLAKYLRALATSGRGGAGARAAHLGPRRAMGGTGAGQHQHAAFAAV